jgi:hypothetical protein
MLDLLQFREAIIKPALQDIHLFSAEAMELLVFTCATESNGGTYIRQNKGPALGIYQMEPATYNDIWQNYINLNPKLAMILSTSFDCGRMPSEDRLIYDLRFATVMARLHYARVKEPIPWFDDINAIWEYYKKYYNTAGGAAEKINSILKYKVFLKTSLQGSVLSVP